MNWNPKSPSKLNWLDSAQGTIKEQREIDKIYRSIWILLITYNALFPKNMGCSNVLSSQIQKLAEKLYVQTTSSADDVPYSELDSRK